MPPTTHKLPISHEAISSTPRSMPLLTTAQHARHTISAKVRSSRPPNRWRPVIRGYRSMGFIRYGRDLAWDLALRVSNRQVNRTLQ